MGRNEDLIRSIARDRDEAAFAAFYDALSPAVFGLACRMLGKREEAEDILQDIFLKVWEKAHSFDPARAPAAGWVMVIARSRCLDKLRRRRLRQDREQSIFTGEEDGDGLLPLAETGPSALDGLATVETQAEAARALAALPEPQRTVLEAACFEGLTQTEIAEKLGAPLGTVKTRMRLGLLKLAEALGVKKGER